MESNFNTFHVTITVWILLELMITNMSNIKCYNICNIINKEKVIEVENQVGTIINVFIMLCLFWAPG